MGPVAALCYWVVYVAGWSIAFRMAHRRVSDRLPRPTRWQIGLWGAVAIPSFGQFAVPVMYDAGRRDPSAISDGEWWRLVTSMVLQDGGWLGTVFNLATLAVTVILVGAWIFGPMMIGVFILGGVVSNILTLVVTAEPGAGNSMATMFLVAAVAVRACLRNRGRRELWAWMIALVLAAVILLTMKDQHGFAVAAGLLTGMVLTAVNRTGTR